MIPTEEGIYEWFDDDGTKRLVAVCDVSPKKDNSYLRVAWGGGYYDIQDSIETLYNCDLEPVRTHERKSEWTGGKWGARLGDGDSIPYEQLYKFPDK